MSSADLTDTNNALSVTLRVMITATFVILLSLFSATATNMVYAQESEKERKWVNKKYKVAGGWAIEKRGEQTFIKFTEKFKTKKGPDLKIFLSPQSISEVTGKTATKGSLLISALQNNKGLQEYVLPKGVNLDDYTSLLIHCEQYSVLWGGADL